MARARAREGRQRAGARVALRRRASRAVVRGSSRTEREAPRRPGAAASRGAQGRPPLRRPRSPLRARRRRAPQVRHLGRRRRAALPRPAPQRDDPQGRGRAPLRRGDPHGNALQIVAHRVDGSVLDRCGFTQGARGTATRPPRRHRRAAAGPSAASVAPASAVTAPAPRRLHLRGARRRAPLQADAAAAIAVLAALARRSAVAQGSSATPASLERCGQTGLIADHARRYARRSMRSLAACLSPRR